MAQAESDEWPMLLCLAARLDGPDEPPYLCSLPAGHGGDHVTGTADEVIWRWPNKRAGDSRD